MYATKHVLHQYVIHIPTTRYLLLALPSRVLQAGCAVGREKDLPKIPFGGEKPRKLNYTLYSDEGQWKLHLLSTLQFIKIYLQLQITLPDLVNPIPGCGKKQKTQRVSKSPNSLLTSSFPTGFACKKTILVPNAFRKGRGFPSYFTIFFSMHAAPLLYTFQKTKAKLNPSFNPATTCLRAREGFLKFLVY